MNGGFFNPHVYNVPSRRSCLLCALKPIGRLGPKTTSPLVASDAGSIATGAPPSQHAKTFPACTMMDVFDGFVGNRPKFAIIPLA